jgi:hypothetical protein
MADLTRQAVEMFLAKGMKSEEELRQRAAEAAGRFQSGSTDVAVNHDRFLAES